jgi:hypothetical protein
LEDQQDQQDFDFVLCRTQSKKFSPVLLVLLVFQAVPAAK